MEEWNQETLQSLSYCFLETFSPAPEPRQEAEAQLLKASLRPNYSLAVLRILTEPKLDQNIRIAAAINFKNHLNAQWAASMPDSEKEQIKTQIVSHVISTNSTPKIQTQLSEALAIIASHDFPKSWPSLLPDLIHNLRKASDSSDYATINGILRTAKSLFKKFYYQDYSSDLLLDLHYCLNCFAAPLLEIFLRTSALIDSSTGFDANGFGLLLESQWQCCRIFYFLNFLALPKYFNDHMMEWMKEFRKYLITNYVHNGAEGLGVIVDRLRTAVCLNINLYMKKFEDEFRGYLNDFASAVWSLLANVSQSSSQNRLVVTGIEFLTSVSLSSYHALLFQGEGVIAQIFHSIAVPNVKLRDEDEEQFKTNYVEFILRDMEGNDFNTRRKMACELLQGIALNYKKQVTDLVFEHIQNLLRSFTANPVTNWKDKECAIYLVISLAMKARARATFVLTCNVRSFFDAVIVPELQSQDLNGFPVLKAAALKFFLRFRNFIPQVATVQLFPYLIQFLGAESNVVHSYAAICIVNLFWGKDEGGQSRYSSTDISPVLRNLMINLFNALKFPESEENRFIMGCIMHALGVAEIAPDIAKYCIAELTSILEGVCKNPRNTDFVHYLIESVAILFRRAYETDHSLISTFENNILPLIRIISPDDSRFPQVPIQQLESLCSLLNRALPTNLG